MNQAQPIDLNEPTIGQLDESGFQISAMFAPWPFPKTIQYQELSFQRILKKKLNELRSLMVGPTLIGFVTSLEKKFRDQLQKTSNSLFFACSEPTIGHTLAQNFSSLHPQQGRGLFS